MSFSCPDIIYEWLYVRMLFLLAPSLVTCFPLSKIHIKVLPGKIHGSLKSLVLFREQRSDLRQI